MDSTAPNPNFLGSAVWSDASFLSLLEALPDAVLVSSRDGKIVHANSKAGVLFGKAREQLIEGAVVRFVPLRLREVCQRDWDVFFTDGRTRQMGAGEQIFIVRADNSEVPVEISLSPLQLGARMLALTTIRDVSEGMAARGECAAASLAAVNDRLRLAMESSNVMGWDWDLKGGGIQRFGDLKATFGSEAYGRDGRLEEFWNAVHADDRERVREALTFALNNRAPYAAEFRVVWPDGMARWVVGKGRFFYSAEGEPERMVGTLTDISDRKLAEDSLRQRERDLADAQRVAQVGSWRWEPETDSMTWSKELYRIYGRDPDLPPVNFAESPKFLTSTSWELLQHAARQAVQNGMPYELDLEIVRRDGSTRWVHALGEPVRNTDGRVIALQGTSQDITERKHAEEALRESEEKFRRVFRNVGVGMVIVSLLGHFLAANVAFCEYLGYTEEELLGKNLQSVTHPEDWPAFSEKLRKAVSEGHSLQRLEKRCLHKTGRIIYTESSASLIRNREGDPQYFVGEVVDVTKRKEAEEALSSLNQRLIEAQEQERTRIGRDLHDDINQRLATLAIEIEQVRLSPPGSAEELSRRLIEIRERISEISSGLQSISRQLHSPQLEYMGIVAAMKTFCSGFSARQRVEIDFSHDDIPQRLPPEISLCLFRVLQEALHNAAKHSQVRYFEVRVGCSANQIHLAVCDRGAGFDTEGVAAKGGLGLVSMRERVRLVGGTIVIASKPMVGTTIDVRVPFPAEQVSERAIG